MRNHTETIIVRNRTYVLFETYTHIDVAQKVVDQIRNGLDFAHIVKARGCNAVYVHRLA